MRCRIGLFIDSAQYVSQSPLGLKPDHGRFGDCILELRNKADQGCILQDMFHPLGGFIWRPCHETSNT